MSIAELEADALALVPTLEGLTVREDNHFTEDHALAAIEAYYDPIIHKLTRDRIERRTAIELPKNKRNGRSQAKHLEGARAIRDINNDNWREGNGRKPKADLVREYAAEHPDANHSEIARALGISRPTVIKWLKDVPKGATEPEKPKPDDLSFFLFFGSSIADGRAQGSARRVLVERRRGERKTGKTGTGNGKIIGNHRENSRWFPGKVPD